MITFARDGAQHATVVVANGSANIGDALGERIFGYSHIVPNLGDDFVLGDEASRVLGKQTEHRIRARPQINMLARVAAQFVSDKIDNMKRQSHLPLRP